MNNNEFEQFIQKNGKDILRYCRMLSCNNEDGDELYQDTMLKLLEKRHKLDPAMNVKSYALSVSTLLWKNRRKKFSTRNRIAKIDSMEEYAENGKQFRSSDVGNDPGYIVERRTETETLLALVEQLPEKYRITLYLYYSANMKLDEISECLHIPLGTVKTRLRKAKLILKERMEALGYDE